MTPFIYTFVYILHHLTYVPLSIYTRLYFSGNEDNFLTPAAGRALIHDEKKITTGRATSANMKTTPRSLHRSLTSLCPPINDHARGAYSSPPYTSNNRQRKLLASRERLEYLTKYGKFPSSSYEAESFPALGNNNGHIKHINADKDGRLQDSLPSVGIVKRELSYSISTIPNTPKTFIYTPSYGSNTNLLSTDMYTSNENLVQPKSISKLSNKQNANNGESSSSDSGYKSKQNESAESASEKAGSRTKPSKLNETWKEDDTHLYSDIKNCDTLFLDIGTKEPPELLAARNLKGKIKKKKVSRQKGKQVGDSSEKTAEDEAKVANTSALLSPGVDVDVSLEKPANETDPPTIKVKKKIKIVIGKRPKTKITRRKSIPDQ